MDRFNAVRMGRIPELDDEDLEALRNLARWLEPGHLRQPDEYLTGPEYERLRMLGLIRHSEPDLERGRGIEITEEGRRVLAEWGGHDG